MWKIESCEVCEFCMLLYYAHISKCGNAFPRVIQKYTKFAGKLHMTVFSTFYDICQLNFTIFSKFRLLFPAVLMDFPNSKVCLIGEWSIDIHES